MYKKGFTLVELLAVIIVLAVILVIAIPKIGDMIGVSRENAFITNVESMMKLTKIHYQENYASSLASSNVVYNISDNKIKQNNVDLKLSSKVGDLTGTIIVNSDGETNVTMQNSNYCATKTFGGKLSVHSISNGTCEGYADAVEYLTQKYNNGTNSEGLIQTNGTELRYQGSNPNNYVYFNCVDNLNPTSSTCEIWRIVGVFDGRVKLVRKDSIGIFSWDSSDFYSEWSPNGTYEGSALMRELNSDYLNASLNANSNWYNYYNPDNDYAEFDKNYVLKTSTQELIGGTLWKINGVPNNISSLSVANAYAYENCSNDVVVCNEDLVKKPTWFGKIGLVSLSDFGYASSNNSCNINMLGYDNCLNNWMNGYGWTVTAIFNKPASVWVNGTIYFNHETGPTILGAVSKEAATIHAADVHPSVYLVPGILIKGSGTTSNPYFFVK